MEEDRSTGLRDIPPRQSDGGHRATGLVSVCPAHVHVHPRPFPAFAASHGHLKGWGGASPHIPRTHWCAVECDFSDSYGVGIQLAGFSGNLKVTIGSIS